MADKPKRGSRSTKTASKSTANKSNKKPHKNNTIPLDTEFIVKGVVRDSNNSPVVGVTVRAYDKDLRKRQKLGETKTDKEGNYTIPYSRKKFRRAEKGNADLFIVVVDNKRKESPPSAIMHNAPAEASINVSVRVPEMSEWERITRDLEPLLRGQEVTPGQLNEEDFEFIRIETGLDPSQVRLWSLAIRTAGETKLVGDISRGNLSMRPVYWNAENGGGTLPVDAMCFYAWYRDGFPTNVTDLLKRSVQDLFGSLNSSIDKNILPSLTKEWLDELRRSIDSHRQEQMLRPGGEGAPANLGDLLNTVSADWLDAGIRRQVADLLSRTDHKSDRFPEEARKLGLADKDVFTLQRTLRLAEFADQNAPVIKALQSFLGDDDDTSLDGLAKITTDQWLDLAYTHSVPTGSFLSEEQYGTQLAARFEAHAPTRVLEEKINAGLFNVNRAGFEAIGKLLVNNPQFDIARSNISAFMRDGNFIGIDAEKRDLEGALRRLQQLKSIGLMWDEASVLLNARIDSIEEIAGYGGDQIKLILGENLDIERVAIVHKTAQAAQALAIGLMGIVQPMMSGVTPAVMEPSKPDNRALKSLDNAPTLRNLFGGLETCTCTSCQSVLSPAAYFVDLLRFVERSRGARALLSRRPDLFDLELSCNNTNIELPHIDLAIEIIENAVALPRKIKLPPGTDPLEQLRQSPVGKEVREAIQKTAVEPLGVLHAQEDKWSIRPLIYKPGTSFWIITDRYRRWVLEAQEEFFGMEQDMLFTGGMLLEGLDVQELLELFNEGQVSAGATDRFKKMLIDKEHSRLPLSVTGLKIETIEKNGRWRVPYRLGGRVIVDDINRSVQLSNMEGYNVKTTQYSDRTIAVAKDQLNEGRLGGLFMAGDPAPQKLAVTKLGNVWKYESQVDREVTIVYRYAGVFISGLTYQSTADDRDLKVRPQNRNPLAYDVLKGAGSNFPWTLPFDFDLTETRALLAKSGYPRIELMESSTLREDRYTSEGLVRERLSLSSEQTDRITQPRSNAELWDAWGLKVSNGLVSIVDTFSEESLPRTGAPMDVLQWVSIVLQQARLSFVEFRELLATDFVDPKRAVAITPLTQCDPSMMKLEGLTPDHLDRLHRFVRLWRVLGWAPWEIDIAITSIANGVLESATLVNLANIDLLRKRLDISVEVLATWLGKFSRTTYQRYSLAGQPQVRPLYDRLFQDRTVLDPPDAALAFANLPANGAPSIRDKATQIATALRTRVSDLIDFAQSDADGLKSVGLDGGISAENLQKFYRNASLIKVLGISISDYSVAWRLINPHAFDSAGSLLHFCDEIEFVRRSDLEFGALEYILRHPSEDDQSWQLPAEQVLAILRELKQAVSQDQSALSAIAPDFGLAIGDLSASPLDARPTSDAERWFRWGFQDEGGSWSVADPYFPNDPTKRRSGAPLTLLSSAGVLAQQARVNDNELWDLLQTKFVDPTALPKLSVSEIGAGDPRIAVANLTVEHLDRLERFLAVKRATGLRAYELDLMLRAFSAGSETEPLKYDLAKAVSSGTDVLALVARLSLPLDVVISWWGGLGTAKYVAHTQKNQPNIVSVYERLFTKAPGLFTMSADRTKLQIEETPPPIKPQWQDVVAQLAEAFAVSEADLGAFVSNGFIGPEITLANLSALHRWVTLSKALKLSAQAIIRMQRSLGMDPFKDTNTALTFVDMAPVRNRRAEAITHTLAERLNLAADIVGDLLWDYLRCPSEPVLEAIELFLSDAFRGERQFLLSSLNATDEYAVVARLHKYSLLNGGWKLKRSELAWLPRPGGTSSEFVGLVVNDLPTVSGAVSANYSEWKATSSLVLLGHSKKSMPQVLADYLLALRTADETAACEVLADAFKLDGSTVKEAAQRFAIVARPTYLDPRRFVQWLGLLTTMHKLGLSDHDLGNLIDDPVTATATTVARNILRSRFGDKDWSEPLRQVINTLRIEQRDRLSDYLVWRDNLRDSTDILELYLIDVAMAPCMVTTRLLQSTAAVQLFVQRCLLNLESKNSVYPEYVDRNRWEWTKNYRVWEANRKVFLYPENWLFPELRDDKSETFRNFESALTQSEPSYENALTAMKGYLDGLLEISQISVMGMFEDAEKMEEVSAGSNASYRRTLYLVGRSPNSPYVYFWRRAIGYGGPGMRWTGWERIDLDLSGDHIIPFVLEGDFHIAWPLIQRKTEQDETYYEVQLAWARRTSSGWIKRKVTRDPPLMFKKLFNRNARTMLAFKLKEEPVENVVIDVYVAQKVNPDTWIDSPNELKSYPPSVINSGPTWHLFFDVQGYVQYTSGRIENIPITFTGTGLILSQSNMSVPFDESEFGPLMTWVPLTVVDPVKKGVTITLTAVASINGKPEKITTKRATLKCKPDGKLTVRVQFLFKGGEDPDPNESSEDQPLVMALAGSFVFANGVDALWSENESLPLPLLDLKDMLSFSSGLRQPSASENGLKGVSSHSGPGRFFAIESRTTRDSNLPVAEPFWYIEEDNTRFFARLPSTGSTAAAELYPSSYMDAGNYKANLSRNPNNLVTESQLQTNTRFGVDNLTTFFQTAPSNAVELMGKQNLAFDATMPYAAYNWEVFFHVPIAVASFLSKQHRFADAQRWFHFIFDPTTNDASPGRERFWRLLPFRDANRPATISELLIALSDPNASPDTTKDCKEQVAAWLADPFNPFAIARLRNGAFQWNTVVGYIRNLISWGDQLFRRDTRESINEAALLYVLAAKILGRRSETIAQRVPDELQLPASYRALSGRWDDDFPNAWVTLLDSPLVQAWITVAEALFGLITQDGWDKIASLGSVGWLYFCVPPNEKLTDLWDIVDDRLFKIRNCQNIEGRLRSLPLFEPPIDPELLIRAKAAGLNLDDVLSDRFAPLPQYRFELLLQKAKDLSNEVTAFGSATLAAVEKKDAERLGLLRSSQETELLKLIEDVKKHQVDEADANLAALRQTRANSLERFRYLQRLLGNNEITNDADGVPLMQQSQMFQAQETGAPDDFRGLALIQSEIDEIWKLQEQHVWSMISGGIKFGSGISHVIAASLAGLPDPPFGPGNKPSNALTITGHALAAAADGVQLFATNASYWERRAHLMAGFQRRRDDWVHQAEAIVADMRQVDKQIAALTIRKTIAEKDLTNHRRQIENATEIEDYLRSRKFSNESLYVWMEGQLSAIHFSGYHQAFDLAKCAERAFRFELGDELATFIQFGYWDNLKKGLLAGERLNHDLRRMESAYFERNRRELEITKHVSVRQIDPMALQKLRANGKCEFALPEVLFDLDFPSHFFRRIKNISVSLPCVVGPYASVSGTLTLLSSKVREKQNPTGGNYNDEANFRISYLPVQSIATSSAQNDSGLFELNFRDERYLPFEGAGVISQWRFSLPDQFRVFDYDTISDLVLHIRYTARDAGENVAALATNAAFERLNTLKESSASGSGLTQIISVRHDYPTAWHLLKTATDDSVTAEIKVDASRFPFLFRDVVIKVAVITVLVVVLDPMADPSPEVGLRAIDYPRLDPTSPNPPAVTLASQWNDNVLQGSVELPDGGKFLDGGKPWVVTLSNAETVKDILFLVSYTIK